MSDGDYLSRLGCPYLRGTNRTRRLIGTTRWCSPVADEDVLLRRVASDHVEACVAAEAEREQRWVAALVERRRASVRALTAYQYLRLGAEPVMLDLLDNLDTTVLVDAGGVQTSIYLPAARERLAALP